MTDAGAGRRRSADPLTRRQQPFAMAVLSSPRGVAADHGAAAALTARMLSSGLPAVAWTGRRH